MSQFDIARCVAMLFTKAVLLLCSFSMVYAGGTQNITLKLESDTTNTVKCVNQEKFFWKEDNSVKIYINSGYINYHDCFYAENSAQKLVLSNFTKHDGKVFVANVLKMQLGKITCQFRFNKNVTTIKPIVYKDGDSYTEVTCKFEIYEKYMKSMKILINDMQLNISDSDDLDGVDGQVTYHYQPNELVRIKCEKPTEVVRKLQYVFVSSHNYTSSDELDSLEFETVLKPEDDGGYVDCVFGDIHPTILRVWLLMSKNEEKNLVRVNGLVIRPSEGKIYIYGYSSGLPNVTCGGEAASIKEVGNGDAEAFCEMMGENTTIKLFKKVTCNGITVEGLSDGEIVFQDCHRNKYHRLVYEYTKDDLIELYCTNGSNVTFNWTINDNLRTNETDGLDSVQVFSRRMQENYDSSTITCGVPGVNTSIEFRHSNNNNQHSTTPQMDHSSEDTTNPSTNKNDDVPKAADFWEKNQKYVAGAGLSLILLLILLCLVAVYVKRRKYKASPSTDISYSNLQQPNQVNRLPRRQNEHIYSNERAGHVEEYAVPVDNMKDSDTYSVPYKPKVEEMYAKPTPKNQRTVPKENVTYAEIGFASNNASVNRKTSADTESPYAEIRPAQQDGYAAVKPKNERNHDYINEFNSNYVNCKSDEYAEPAYCQVGMLQNK